MSGNPFRSLTKNHPLATRSSKALCRCRWSPKHGASSKHTGKTSQKLVLRASAGRPSKR